MHSKEGLYAISIKYSLDFGQASTKDTIEEWLSNVTSIVNSLKMRERVSDSRKAPISISRCFFVLVCTFQKNQIYVEETQDLVKLVHRVHSIIMLLQCV